MSVYNPKTLIKSNLSLLVELDYVVSKSYIDYQNALKISLKFTKLLDINHVFVNLKLIDAHVEFDEIHSMPHPIEVVSYPVVIEYYYCEENNRCFIKTQQNLNYYDGLSVLQTSFSILEYLEHSDNGSVPPEQYMTSPDRFKGHNVPTDISNFKVFINFIYLMCNQLWYLVIGFIKKYFYRSKDILVGAMTNFNEIRPRYWIRYNDVQIKYSKLLDLCELIKNQLGLPFVTYTINFAPKVSLGFLPNFQLTKSNKSRINALSLPIGPPAPMDAQHVTLTSTSIFLNNYGKFDPNITGQPSGFLWNWVGLSNNFSSVMMAISIKNKLFVEFSLPAAHAKHSKIMELLKSVDAKGGSYLVSNQPFVQIPHLKQDISTIKSNLI